MNTKWTVNLVVEKNGLEYIQLFQDNFQMAFSIVCMTYRNLFELLI